MKLEIRKETKPDGDMFFHIYVNDRFVKSFWIGNHISGDEGCYNRTYGEDAAFAEAQRYYDRLKLNATSEPIVEVIKSEEI
jgi:hypothetical protein